MWYIVVVGILLIVIYDMCLLLINPKPSFKSQLKRIFNQHISIMAVFMPMNMGMLLLSAYVGFVYLGKHSSDVNVITVATGMQWGMFIMVCSLYAVILYKVGTPMIKRQPNEFSQWLEHLDIDGIWRYTESEKEYNKEQDIKDKEQLRRWFPFIKKFDKKVKDGTL